MQVTDEDMVNAVEVGLEFHQLHLRALAAVYQETPVLNFYQLCRRMTSVSRQRPAGSENGYFKAHGKKQNDQNGLGFGRSVYFVQLSWRLRL
jgi:hypothetical protein